MGFGIVISDKNKDDLLDLYHPMAYMDLEFGNATMHNSFYFLKFIICLQLQTLICITKILAPSSI